MLGRAERLVYRVSQTARVSWYLGQYWLAARLNGPSVRLEERSPGLEMPGLRDILADLEGLLARDLANIEAGYYRLPHDLVARPGRALGQAAAFFQDLPAVRRRRRGRINAEVLRAPPPGSERLPRYFRQNFHYQTDGYLSDRSARLYDHQVEVLFTGGADAMRRQALVPMAQYLRARGVAGARVVDVAAGTGRFLTFVKDNWPRLDVTAVDLSLPYLAEARRRLRPWARTTRVVQAPAEALPLAGESVDLVTCIYLFHELPRAVRALAAAEMARVLKPGGRLILVDSIQLGDKPMMDGLIDLFPRAFHEPYYAGYARADLPALFAEVGLALRSVELAFMSKVLVLEKPGP
ncbi:MAG TPA: class I SAM-dependent methyltransferase [Azospirillaceae bacterium]|nr:class I SAM-dependent methyltransferase [Azospirillaceae bacterium]